MKLFFSTGAMKAGTTWLYSVLLRHPDLYFTPEKEIHFLKHHFQNENILRDEFRLKQAQNTLKPDRITNINRFKAYARWYGEYYLEDPVEGFEWYESLFRNNRKRKYNCDFSNLSCHLTRDQWETVIERYEDVKAIYVLRDPIKRLWSHIKFHHQFSRKTADLTSWNEPQYESFIRNKFISENTTYTDYIKEMKAAFDEKNFKIFFFEDFTTNPRETFKELEAFLEIRELDYKQEHLEQKINSSKKIVPPDSFLNAASEFLKNEYDQLKSIGIDKYSQ